MSEALPELRPDNTAASLESAFRGVCSLKRLGVTVREDLLQLLPQATEFIRTKITTEPLLEIAAASAASGATARGILAIRKALSALIRGAFFSPDIPNSVLVALRDEHSLLEGSLTAGEQTKSIKTERLLIAGNTMQRSCVKPSCRW